MTYSHSARSNLRTTEPESLIGRQVYFQLSKKKMDEFDDPILDLTPKKLYTIKEHIHGWLFSIHDNANYPRTINLSKFPYAAELKDAAKWQLKSQSGEQS